MPIFEYHEGTDTGNRRFLAETDDPIESVLLISNFGDAVHKRLLGLKVAPG